MNNPIKLSRETGKSLKKFYLPEIPILPGAEFEGNVALMRKHLSTRSKKKFLVGSF